jgi:dihydrofolate synthase/folylpolyglutamate synthase
MTFDDALRWLEGRQETRWKLGLTRIEGLLQSLNNPQNNLKVIHVAGTNGKGSFCAQMASVLSACGLKTGLFTSPHLSGPRERIRIDGAMIPAADFGRILGQVQASETEQASYFEILTAAAFTYFVDQNVDVVVLEVGLGGRLDATNVVERPLLSVITSISVDHVKQLGDTLDSIAREKAGIIKKESPCLSGEDAPEALAVIRERAYEVSAPLSVVRPAYDHVEIDWQAGAQTANFAGRGPVTVGMLGDPALKTAGLVLEAAEVLREAGYSLPAGSVRRGLREVDWPARFEPVAVGGRVLIFDGAHNPAAMRSFVETWRQSPWASQDALFIFGVLKDKNYREMISLLGSIAKKVIVTCPDSARALPAAEAAQQFDSARCEVQIVEDPKAAFALWQKSDVSCGAVCGSFYLIGSLHPKFQEPVA